MTALDYPISLPFGATSDGYSKAHPHLGNDYAAPEGCPVVVAGTQIGLTGHTGKADGPHVHVQAGTDVDAQEVVDAKPYTNKPGTVVQAEFRSEWGNFVNILCDGMYVHYCHLQRIDVTVGQEIGVEMPQEQDVTNYFLTYLGYPPTPDQVKYYTERNWQTLASDVCTVLLTDKYRLEKQLADAGPVGTVLKPGNYSVK